jgi:hypothetical protein
MISSREKKEKQEERGREGVTGSINQESMHYRPNNID